MHPEAPAITASLALFEVAPCVRSEVGRRDATGLPRGESRWLLPGRAARPMPRACPVEGHGGCYRAGGSAADATGLPRGGSRWLLPSRGQRGRCHGLAPWRVTLVTTEPGA